MRAQRTQAPTRHARRGFTLIELLVTLAVASMLVVVAVPNFQAFVNSSRLAGAANEMIASLQLARAEAIRRNGRAGVCMSSGTAGGDTASCATGAAVDGWIAFVDANEDGDYDKDDDDTFLRGTMLDGPMGVDVSPAISANKVASVIFRPDGLARNENSGGGPGTGLLDGALRLCIATTRPPNNARDVQIVSGSRIAAVQVDGGGACAAPANP